MVRPLVVSLLFFGPLGTAGAQEILPAVKSNRVNLTTGSTLVLAVEVDNPGLPTVADFYVGAVLPDGDTVLTFIDLVPNAVMGNLSNLSSLRPIAAAVDLTEPFEFASPTFLLHQWEGTEPSGGYTPFVAALEAGALDDGVLDDGEILALEVTGLNAFEPIPGSVEARLERNYTRGNTDGDPAEQVLNVFFQAPIGDVASVSITGDPFSSTDVPFLGTQASPEGTLDVFNLRYTSFAFPNIDEVFTFEVVPDGGGPTETFTTTFRNTPTSDAIEVSIPGAGPDPFALNEANFGAPLEVQWTLPSFDIDTIQLSPVANNASGTFCQGLVLSANDASGTVQFASDCDGSAVTKASVCVFVNGVQGEKTAACHFFEDP